MVKTLEGKGFRGQRTEKELENFLLYNSSLRTTEPVELAWFINFDTAYKNKQ